MKIYNQKVDKDNLGLYLLFSMFHFHIMNQINLLIHIKNSYMFFDFFLLMNDNLLKSFSLK